MSEISKKGVEILRKHDHQPAEEHSSGRAD